MLASCAQFHQKLTLWSWLALELGLGGDRPWANNAHGPTRLMLCMPHDRSVTRNSEQYKMAPSPKTHAIAMRVRTKGLSRVRTT